MEQPTQTRISHESTRPSVVLVTTEMEWSARSLETLLNPHGYAVLRAATDRQVVEMAVSTRPDAVILEHRPPQLDAVAACRWLRQDPRFEAATPILVVSSSPVDRAQRIAIFDAGAWDHWTQPLDMEVLLRQLRTLIGVKRQMERAQEVSLVEAATGIYNSRGLAQRAREIGAGALRRHEPLACVAFALALDPPVPRDDLLSGALTVAVRQLAAEWQRLVRADDALGRLGPAEFGIVAPGTNLASVGQLVIRLKARVEALPVAVEGADHALRLRAECTGVDDYALAATDALELLRRASRALREAEHLRESLESPEHGRLQTH